MSVRMIIGAKQLQVFLQARAGYTGAIDGAIGPQSIAAATRLVNADGVSTQGWPAARVLMAAQQAALKNFAFYEGVVDGYFGPHTQYAIELWQNATRSDAPPVGDGTVKLTQWPVYSEMTRFYGKPGENQGRFLIPYPMILAWDKDTSITRMTLNNKCGASAMEVFEECLSHYGQDGIHSLRLNLFGGSLNVRKMRGSNRMSTHSWGCAIDIDPEHNQLRWSNLQATLADPPYDFWWAAWEKRGWVSLGRERNFDWMHVQASRL